MNHKLLTRSLLAAGIALAVSSAQAAEVRINGFASIVAGKTFSEGTDNTSAGSAKGESTFQADQPTQGTYDSTLDFKPDTVYGLQFTADLGDKLSVTGQLTGAGGEDFETKVTWAYATYELNENWTVQAGRQRIPLFFYSDFLDVGYAYHWMRPPTETNLPVDSYDGLQLTWQSSIGNWDSRAQFYLGSSEAETESVGLIGLDNLAGAVFYTTNDWLQLRATHLQADMWIDQLSSDSLASSQLTLANQLLISGTAPDVATANATAAGMFAQMSNDAQLLADGQGEDKPVGVEFSGLAAHATFGDMFAVAEYTVYEFDDPIISEGWTEVKGYYLSLGYRMGSLTPHITYSVYDRELENYYNPNVAPAAAPVAEATEESNAVTLGLRWDFHPAAAIKLEYTSRSDDSDQEIEDIKGDWREVDLFTAGIDIIF